MSIELRTSLSKGQARQKRLPRNNSRKNQHANCGEPFFLDLVLDAAENEQSAGEIAIASSASIPGGARAHVQALGLIPTRRVDFQDVLINVHA